MNIPIARPFRKMQIAVAILMALVLTSISLQPSEAQTGPETIWEEERAGDLVRGRTRFRCPSGRPNNPGTHYRTYSGIAFRPTVPPDLSSIGAAIYVTMPS